jgi:hypothetical protein
LSEVSLGVNHLEDVRELFSVDCGNEFRETISNGQVTLVSVRNCEDLSDVLKMSNALVESCQRLLRGPWQVGVTRRSGVMRLTHATDMELVEVGEGRMPGLSYLLLRTTDGAPAAKVYSNCLYTEPGWVGHLGWHLLEELRGIAKQYYK